MPRLRCADGGDPADRGLLGLLVLDTSGRLHRLLAGPEGQDRADWLATRLRDAMQPRALED